MKKQPEKTSSEKENKKVKANKGAEDYKVREDENNSIYEEANDKKVYPYKAKKIFNIKYSLNLSTGIVIQKIRVNRFGFQFFFRTI
ncbi:MAG TPA: hypothetical protein VFW07_23025 [Parafilimonas sp.]|nr:hypothetical protein [Parafilimonas sp.]